MTNAKIERIERVEAITPSLTISDLKEAISQLSLAMLEDGFDEDDVLEYINHVTKSILN